MTEFRSLKLLDVFRPLFQKLNIDYDVMRKILQVKLMMDGRRVPTIFSGQTKKRTGNQFLKSLLLYMLYSLILVPFVFGEQMMFQMSLVFGIMMFFLMTSMIADFSSVLLDVRDKTILHTKPIHSRTISAAKFVHVLIYMTFLTGAFTIIPSIVMLFTQEITFLLLFVVLLIFLVLFIIAVTSLIYIFVLRFFSGEQLKDMINYIQITLSVGIIIGYQIVIRAFDFTYVYVVYDFSWWHVFIPPMWFAAPYELLLGRNFSGSVTLLSMFAIIIPIVAILMYYKLMPAFEQNLQKLMEDSGGGKRKKRRLSSLWERLICFHKEERMFFRFANQMMGEEREFKLKVYPSLGMALVFPFIFIFNELSYRTLEDIGTGNMFLYIYFINAIVGVIVYMLQFSGKYKGAWIFASAAIEHPGRMYSATLKAFFVKLYLPVFVIVSIIYCYIFSSRILLDLFVVFFVAVLQALIVSLIAFKGEYLFSKPFEDFQQGGGNAVLMFGLMIVVLIFAGVHYLMIYLPYGVPIYLVVLVGTVLMMWKSLFSKRHVG